MAMVTKKEYAAIVAKEVKKLEKAYGYTINHGDAGDCPRCGRGGIFDIDGVGLNMNQNSIFYCVPVGGWRCLDCNGPK